MRSIIHFEGAVGVDRRARIGFRQRLAVGLAVDRAGRREHQTMAAGFAHRSQERQRPGDIVKVVFLRVGHGFADQARRREMHHGRDVVLREHARQHGLVEEVADHERSADEATMAGREVVVDDRTKARRASARQACEPI
jgi:hypothetical protein